MGISLFYNEMVTLMDVLVAMYGEAAVFSGDPALQLNASSSRGMVQAVHGHKDARAMLIGVLEQGAGPIPPRAYDESPFNHIMELPHFHRFNEIVRGRYYDPIDMVRDPYRLSDHPHGARLDTNWSEVRDFLPNPRAADYRAHPDIYKKMMQFSACYTDMLTGLDRVFNGAPEDFIAFVGSMYNLGALARDLMEIPIPGNPGKTVGPSWEWVNATESQIPCPSQLMKTLV